MPWTNIRPFAPPAAGIRNLWTRAIIRNTLYLYNQGQATIFEIDTSTPGDVNVIDQIPTFLNMAGIEGIFEARSRLGAWDSTNSIFWSDTSNVLDFVPDLKTRANSVKVDALKGNIIMILPATEGFIIYTTANIVGATYAPNTQKVFEFFEISDHIGIFSDYSVMTGEGETAHYAYTNGGLYRIENKRGGASAITPEVTDYITSFEQSPRISFHLNRYIAIWLFGEGVDDARTVRQKNFIDATTYWRQNRFPYDEYLNQLENMQGLIALDSGFDFSDLYPIECYPELGDGICDDQVLWAAVIQEHDQIEIERYSQFSEFFIDEGPISFTMAVPSSGLGFDRAKTDVPGHRLTDDTLARLFNNYSPLRGITRYSFDPNALIMYQAYVWQAEDNNNFRHLFDSQVFTGVSVYNTNERVRTTAVGVPGSIVVESDTTVIDETITDDSRTGSYDCIETFDQVTEFTTYKNIRQITTEAFATKERRVVIESFSRTFRAWSETRFPADGGSHDGEIVAGPFANSVGSLQDDSNTGVSFLRGLILGLWEEDAIFKALFFKFGAGNPDARTGFNKDAVNGLADDTWAAPAIDPNFWSTASNIAGHSDRCTYANIRNFSKNRAVAALKQDFIVTDILRFEFKDFQSDEDVYSTRRTQQITDSWPNLNRLSPDILTLPPIPNEIPIKQEVVPFAVGRVRRSNGAKPSSSLETMYNDAVLEQVSVLQAFANAGWTIDPPPASTPNTPPTFTITGGDPGNTYNAQATLSFLEYFENGLLCGRLLDFTVSPFNLDQTAGKFEPFEQEILPDITLPETVFLTQTGAPGQLFPLYNRALIWDRLLQKWGTCDVDFRLFLDFSPINEVAFDPILEEFVTRFTYDNFLSRLGSLAPSGMLVLFDDQPDDAYLVYGKIGWRRSKLTMLSEVFMEFAENPNANFILESSLDRRTLDPYNMRSIPLVRAGETWYGSVSARWFNLVIRGRRFHLTGLEFQGITLGRE